jgi:hypothetical protein
VGCPQGIRQEVFAPVDPQNDAPVLIIHSQLNAGRRRVGLLFRR